MGTLEVAMLAMIGRIVVLGMEIFRSTNGSRILEFADGLNLVICKTLFMKMESQLVIYAARPVKSTVDNIIVQQEDKEEVRNVKVIPNEECVPLYQSTDC